MARSPNDPPVVFTSAVEGMVRAVGKRMDPDIKRKFAELGIPLDGKLQPAYPQKAFLACGLYLSQLLHPHLPPHQQKVELGRRFVHGYGETIVGMALMTAMRVLGPKRSLARFERNLHTGNNYSSTALRETAQGLELDVMGAPYPEFYEGMVIAALEVSGAKDIVVKIVRDERPVLATLKISFK